MKITSLDKILQSHFKEPNSTTLFTALSNSIQVATESAQEYVMRLMPLRQKILVVTNEENCSYSEDSIHDSCRFDENLQQK